MKVHLEESGEHSKPWKLKMIRVIREQIVGPKTAPRVAPYPGPVEVRFEVRFDREYGANGELKESSNTPWPTSIVWGDIDKLERNLLDALTQSGLIADDRLVVAKSGRKRWTRENEEAGIMCRVTMVDDEDA